MCVQIPQPLELEEYFIESLESQPGAAPMLRQPLLRSRQRPRRLAKTASATQPGKPSLSALPQIYIFHIYTRPKFTKPTFTQNPYLHKLKFTQLRFTHIQIYTAPYWHTQIYTTQIYTKLNPNLHNPNLHKTRIHRFINPWLVQKRLLPCSRSDAQR